VAASVSTNLGTQKGTKQLLRLGKAIAVKFGHTCMSAAVEYAF
jgi:hypothetical protein